MYVTAFATYFGNSLLHLYLRHYFMEVDGAIFVMSSIFVFMGLTPSRGNQKPKYSILVSLKKDF